MSKNKKIVSTIIGIIVLVGVFYGGMAYGKSQTTIASVAGAGARTGQFGGAGRSGNRIAGGGFVTGQIISKDATSVTVQLTNPDPTDTTSGSGSKIVFFDPSTAISKTATGSTNDLTTGTQVVITGTTNTDGSVTAKSIQIRPLIRPGTPAQ